MDYAVLISAHVLGNLLWPLSKYATFTNIHYLNMHVHKIHQKRAIGGFHSKTIHGETPSGQLHAYCRIIPCESRQISLDFHIFFLPNIR